MKWPKFDNFRLSENSQNINTSYIILKHVIKRSRICNYFREIFKFRDLMNNNRFRENHFKKRS